MTFHHMGGGLAYDEGYMKYDAIQVQQNTESHKRNTK